MKDVCETQLNEADKPKQLVAADFGHAHTFGRAYYVATRFFDRHSFSSVWRLSLVGWRPSLVMSTSD